MKVSVSRPLSAALLVACLLFLLILTVDAAPASTAERSGKTAASPFGPLVHAFPTMMDYQHHLSFSTNPLVLFLFDREPQAVAGFWQPLLSSFSQAMEKFGVEVAEAAPTSEVGQQLQQAIGGSTAVLFFQGVGDTPVNGEKGLKVPIAYDGLGDLVALSKWALSCISPSTTHRVHNESELARFFAFAPQYPNLPRVLYFPKLNYTHPSYMVVSQRFSYDAVFAVVPGAFESPEATAIAERYGVRDASQLPALVVLHKAPDDEEHQGVGEADYAVRMNATEHEWSYTGVSAFLESQIDDTIVKLVAVAEQTQNPRILAAAEARRKYMATALVERQQDVVDEERLQMAVQPLVVTEHAAWAEKCVLLPKGHKCLIAFVDSSQDPRARDNAARVLSIVSVKLMEMLGVEARAIGLVIVDSEGSAAVREYFETGHNGFPDVVLLSLERPAKYYNFVGSFSAEALLDFVLQHDPRLAKREVRGGHAFIPRMVPKLESVVSSSTDDDAGDL